MNAMRNEAGPVPSDSPDSAIQKRTRPRRWPFMLVALMLGALTTYAIAIGSAFLFSARSARSGITERDGDHMQLWLLRADVPAGSRIIWFEKGRIYNKPGVGPSGGSSAAVSCWSYATNTRAGRPGGGAIFGKGIVDLPPDERARITEAPAKVWGAAIDRRGWPLPALEGRASGTMNAASTDAYIAEAGYLLRPNAKFFGFGGGPRAFNASDSLADVRIFPTIPLWRGLLINTAVFAATWWAMLTIAGAGWKRLFDRRRGRAGLCKHCGYDLAGLDGPTCPECGKVRA